MFLPCRASETFVKSSASFSMFLQPMMTRGRSVASATDLAISTHSSTERLSPLGSAPSKWRQMNDAPCIVSTRFAMSATVWQPA